MQIVTELREMSGNHNQPDCDIDTLNRAAASLENLYAALHSIMEMYGPGTLATDAIYEDAVRALCDARGQEFPE